GRILDWHLAKTGKQEFLPSEDPGVISVTQIYNFYKQHGYQTIVMGASFRNIGEIEQLAGCDRLTISPQLLEELAAADGPLERRLNPKHPGVRIEKPVLDEARFRFALNDDAMATEK